MSTTNTRAGNMRSRILLPLILVLTTGLSGQELLHRGLSSLGGSIFYSKMTTKYTYESFTHTTYSVSPSYARFVTDIVELSVSASLTKTYSSNSILRTLPFAPGNFEISQRSIDLGLGVRVFLLNGPVAPFVGGAGRISWQSAMSTNNTPFASPRTGYDIVAGVVIFLSPSVALEPQLRYAATRLDPESTITQTFLGIRAGYYIP